MARKIYSTSVKIWAKKFGIPSGIIGSIIFLYILYTIFIGAMTIIGYSGNMVCAGTEDDPCYAYINFTVNEDVFWYPTDYDPWGRNETFGFDPDVKSWVLQRSWGSGWRTIPMDKSCTGTWCGAPDNTGTVTYSVVWRAGKSYQIRIIGYKNNPKDTIKWSFGSVDPYWYGINKQTIPLTTEFYTGDYHVASQSGNESLYDVNITKDEKTNLTTICLEAGWDKKQVDVYKIDEKTEKEVLDYSYNYSVPLSLSFYKTAELSRETDLIKTKASILTATSSTNPNEFCYIADPKKDFYLKFGDESVIVIQGSDVYAGALVNVTAETNFTHLTMTTTSPYDGLMGYWGFDNQLAVAWSNRTIYDFSSKNKNGALTGPSTVDSNGCLYGDCFHSDGINLVNDPLLNLDLVFSIVGNSSITIMAWIYPENIQSVSADARVFSSGTECVLRFLTTNNNMEFILNTFTTNDRISSAVSTITPNTWSHVVGMYDNSTNNLTIWINGVNRGYITPTGKWGTCNNWYIGGYVGASSPLLNGSIDEVMIFYDSLTEQEIKDVYNNWSSRFMNPGNQTINDTDIACYQETANVSASCGGLNTGAYWNETNNFYINYTKPENFSQAVWKVRHGDLIYYTIAIPSDCFNNPVQLRFYSSQVTFGGSISYGQCRNSTEWKNITQISSGDSTGWVVGGLDYPYDGNWNTGGVYSEDTYWGGTAGLDPAAIYEEGMYWMNETNRINITTWVENNLGSSINLTLGYYNTSGWFYTAPQTVSSGNVLGFNVSGNTTSLNLNYSFYAGNSTYPFYSPIIKDNVTIETWYEEEAPPGEDTTPPSIIYTPPTGILGSLLKINITASDTQSNISVFTDIDGDLLLWLRMDELNATNDIIDNSTYQDNCSAYGGQQINDGALGKGWEPIDITPLTVDQDAINCGNSTRFNVTTALTLSGWFYLKGNYSSNTQSGIRRDDSFILPYIDASSTSITSWIKNATTWYPVTAITEPIEILNEWAHMAVTYNGSVFSLYINGVLENSSLVNGNVTWNSNNVWIGKENGAPLYLNGSFDDIMIFNRSLNADEIAALYANQTNRDIYTEYSVGTGTHNYTSWAQDSAGNVNSTTNTTEVTGDTCTYTSGNWAIDCADNCIITSNVNLGGNNITMLGSGVITLNANITNFIKALIGVGCRVTCGTGCFRT